VIVTNYILITNDKFLAPGTYTIEMDVKKGKKEIRLVLQGVRVVRENKLKVRKPMSIEARKNISKGRKAYYKKLNGAKNNAQKS
jgi:hypothetical protein